MKNPPNNKGGVTGVSPVERGTVKAVGFEGRGETSPPTTQVIISCERSQAICKAFRWLGVEAYSNDIEPCYGNHPEWHIQCDARSIDFSDFKIVIAHPPCTYLSNCQPRKLFNDLDRYKKRDEAVDFFMFFYNLDNDHICIENPIPMKGIGLPVYSQIIQPYNFGVPYSKATCLWLKGLPPLFNTCICNNHTQWVNVSRNADVRARTFDNIAAEIAKQWKYILE